MAKTRGTINRPEAEKIARQITQETREERFFGYEPEDDYAQGIPGWLSFFKTEERTSFVIIL
ncbi:MAG: hypothetical protein ACOY3U_02225 [Bacillota bacterium]